MKGLIASLLPLALAQIVVFLLLVGLALPALYDWQYRLVDDHLAVLGEEVQARFHDLPQEDWDEAIAALEEGALFAEVVAVDDEEIPPEALEVLPTLVEGELYYPPGYQLVYLTLPGRQALELQSLASPFVVENLVELVLFISLSITALIVLAVQISRREALLQARLERRLTDQRDLLHGVAHELRSPMARLRFGLDMLPESSDQQDQESLLASANKNLDALDAMIGELLQYSRLQDAGALRNAEPVDLDAVAREALEGILPLYDHVVFRSELEPRLVCSGDHTLLVRVFTNLLRNSGRYARESCVLGGRREGNMLLLWVDDDGDGIPPGKRERIFEPFTCLDPSRSRDSGGVGLGLAIVRSILRMHGGSIRASESPWGGARFELRIPAQA